MTYAQAVAHLNALVPELAPPANASAPRRHFDLEHMRRLCAALGDPQSRVPAVLIGGTNGKGSTAATLASILNAAGYTTGLYTSPHLIRVNERIQLSHPVLPGEYGAASVPGSDGPLVLREIPDADFAELYTRVEEAGAKLVRSGELPFAPSFFERITATAFLYFAQRQADIAILEVGLGGRLDATNVVDPVISVLTDISLDHQEYLGDTIAAITAEKCGILRPGGTLVTLPQHAEANQAIGEAAMRLGVHGISAAEYLPGRASAEPEAASYGSVSVEPVDTTAPHYHPHQGRPSDTSTPAPAAPVMLPAANRYSLPLHGSSVEVRSPLPGEHQRRNIALAIATAMALRNPIGYEPFVGARKSYNLSWESISQGIAQTKWPGRLEFIAPNLLLDVAHNPAGAWTLRSALATLPEAQPRTLIFSCLRDKSLSEMARILFPLFDSAGGDPLRAHDHIILAPIGSPRASSVQDLVAAAHSLAIPAHAAPHLAGALQQARQITPPGGLIVATGSVYLVGELRALALAGKEQPVHA